MWSGSFLLTVKLVLLTVIPDRSCTNNYSYSNTFFVRCGPTIRCDFTVAHHHEPQTDLDDDDRDAYL
jgi:hypothetical protein